MEIAMRRMRALQRVQDAQARREKDAKALEAKKRHLRRVADEQARKRKKTMEDRLAAVEKENTALMESTRMRLEADTARLWEAGKEQLRLQGERHAAQLAEHRRQQVEQCKQAAAQSRTRY